MAATTYLLTVIVGLTLACVALALDPLLAMFLAGGSFVVAGELSGEVGRRPRRHAARE